jgi:hypothetical protein
MTDQSLREALEAQAKTWEGHTSDNPDVATGFELAAGKLRALLAAHPAEPAPVKKCRCNPGGARTGWPHLATCPESPLYRKPDWDDDAQRRYESDVAAGMPRLPGDIPAPVGVEITDEARKAGLEALHADPDWHKPDSGSGVWRANYGRAVDLVLEAARPFMTSRPALDWDQVAEAIATKAMHYDSGTPFDQVDREDQAGLVAATDAVMALAVPVPTREAIAQALHDRYWPDCRDEDCPNDHFLAHAAAVLALLNGSAK